MNEGRPADISIGERAEEVQTEEETRDENAQNWLKSFEDSAEVVDRCVDQYWLNLHKALSENDQNDVWQITWTAMVEQRVQIIGKAAPLSSRQVEAFGRLLPAHLDEFSSPSLNRAAEIVSAAEELKDLYRIEMESRQLRDKVNAILDLTARDLWLFAKYEEAHVHSEEEILSLSNAFLAELYDSGTWPDAQDFLKKVFPGSYETCREKSLDEKTENDSHNLTFEAIRHNSTKIILPYPEDLEEMREMLAEKIDQT